MKQIVLLAICLLFSANAIAQNTLPVIRANNPSVDIFDGNKRIKNAWTIMPDVKPDIYTCYNKNKKITFYTDIDSISFRVKPSKTYDFIILLNGKDSALTQIKCQKAEQSYLGILKKAAKYTDKEQIPIPTFTYQSMHHPQLVLLRKELKLDSIAGKGNEISQILNLLHWIHYLIPHDGQHGNPDTKNAISFIKTCKQDKRGLNCRGLATTLNECYLAMGFKSRFLTCMPKDSVFDDCHVINMVYSNDLKKWIWVDPTSDTYIMNEKGELLSIQEVRERIIHNKPLILNPDANWNRTVSQKKEEYLYKYMAKNLYRFECPLVSEYDTETAQKGKNLTYIELLPVDAYNQNPKKSSHKNEKTGIQYTQFKTNNPNLFWANPN